MPGGIGAEEWHNRTFKLSEITLPEKNNLNTLPEE